MWENKYFEVGWIKQLIEEKKIKSEVHKFSKNLEATS